LNCVADLVKFVKNDLSKFLKLKSKSKPYLLHLGVDSSWPALDLANLKAELNCVADFVTFVKNDLSTFLKLKPEPKPYFLHSGVDSSWPALDLANRNAELNGVADRVTFVKNDLSKAMKAYAEAGEKFDIVVLDPPKLAPNRKSLGRARIK
jgi:23S rRNA G2069 N7-methylase RlmK/C1962 C5-methylase RlmI